MTQSLTALRVLPAHWLNDAALDRLLQSLARYPGAVDELVFFTAETHPPLPLDEFESRCQRLAAVLPRVRAHGYGAGINILATMGHHEEDLAHSLDEAWPRVTDLDGNISRGSYCPAAPELLDYVNQIYALVAQAAPDVIWVDDDIRLLGHMPIRATCFCSGCIARFNQEVGGKFDRQSLAAALQQPPTPDRNNWRSRWVEHNRRMITTILRHAAEAVHRVNPTIPLGFMTGERFYEGYAFEEWAEALTGTESGPARWRPGGGFYTDDAYMGLVDKAHEVGRQVARLPANITHIQSEIENFPYQRLRKSVKITLLEATAHIASGATGTAFNILSQHADPLDEYHPFFERIAQCRPFLDRLGGTLGRAPAVGVWPAWNSDAVIDHMGTGEWPASNDNLRTLRQPYVLGELGLPIAYRQEDGRITALAGALPAAFSRQALKQIFQGGVIMDGAALQSLTALGLERWAGTQVREVIDRDMSEVLSAAPLNGRFAGWARNCRQSFWPQPAFSLEPAGGTEVLAALVDYTGTECGVSMTAYENELGGRVVVMGYSPWTLVHNQGKVGQLRRICDWASRDRLPVVVETYARVQVWARTLPDGGLGIVLLNASLDAIPELELRIRTEAETFDYLCMDGRHAPIRAHSRANGTVNVMLRDITPWSMHLLCTEPHQEPSH